MSNQDISVSRTHRASRVQDIDRLDTRPSINAIPAPSTPGVRTSFFWQHRLTEVGLILSMAFYYLVGNPNIKVTGHSQAAQLLTSFSQHVNPLYSLPLLFIFVLLSWHRLAFAVALLPLSFPYYYIQKTVYQTTIHGRTNAIAFSLVEIALWTCIGVACLQAVFLRRQWSYRLSCRELCARIGPFMIPVLIFFGAALLANFIAYSRVNALRAFREEVVDPLLYLLLLLACLRSYWDVKRLLVALFGMGFVIALLGIIQDLFLRNLIKADAEGLVRITTVYGSGNNIGLLFDYALPIGLAIVLSRISWKWRVSTFVLCLPFIFVLYKSASRGAWLVAMPITLLFILAFAMRNRKLVVSGGIVLTGAALVVAIFLHSQIADFIINGHTNGQSDSYKSSTVLKRPYLWQTALNMIHDSPWLGYGMDNWLCHYSNSWKNSCLYSDGRPTNLPWPQQIVPDHPKLPAYWITNDPVTHQPTGLSDEPALSHPHNIFLHVWVSMGIFGLLAFIAVIMLFYWLFACMLIYIYKIQPAECEQIRWMIVSVGAAMLAALIQGQIDSAFLEQDLSFCFWTLIAAILLLRTHIGMPWRMLWPVNKFTS